MSSLLARIRSADSLFYAFGWIHLAAAFLFLCFAPWDDRIVTGVNPWIKPTKFTLSFTLLFWTLAFYLRELGRPLWTIRTIHAVVGIVSVIEIGCIAMQAARGVPSHFNATNPFNASVFGIMGLAILINTFAMLLLLFQMLWQEGLETPPAVLMGMRLGLVVFVLGSIQGFYMVLNQAHTVGAPDGGPGLPFLNWSTTHGDLRVAHMLGLHSLQILPLAGLWIDRRFGSRPPAIRAALAGVIALVWIAAFAGAFLLAIQERPLLSLGRN
ncbi:MAG: hypothetical protein R2762_05485 [Bryobacteraceae bacterium]